MGQLSKSLSIINNTGVRNLKEKGIDLPANKRTTYDIVKAIAQIEHEELGNGKAIQSSPLLSASRESGLTNTGKAWVTSWGTVYPTDAIIRQQNIEDQFQGAKLQCYINFDTINDDEIHSISIPTKLGDSLFCAIWYTIPLSMANDEIALSYSEGWEKIISSENLISGDTCCKVIILQKNNKAIGEIENFTINRTNISLEATISLFDIWNYQDTLDFVNENTGTTTQSILKNETNSYLWVLRAIGSESNRYSMTPDTVNNQLLFKSNKQNYAIIMDNNNDKKTRTFSFVDGIAFSCLSLKLKGEN